MPSMSSPIALKTVSSAPLATVPHTPLLYKPHKPHPYVRFPISVTVNLLTALLEKRAGSQEGNGNVGWYNMAAGHIAGQLDSQTNVVLRWDYKTWSHVKCANDQREKPEKYQGTKF